MMGGNPNNNKWWNMINSSSSSLIPSQYVLGSSPSIPFTEIPEPSHSWSQLLFTGLPGEEERVGFSHFQSKKMEENNNNINNWDDDQNTLIINNNNNPSSPTRVLHNNNNIVDVIKHDISQTGNFYGRHSHEEFQASSSSWSHNNHNNMVVPVSSSSPRSSSVTSLSSINSNLLNFTYNNSISNKNKVSDHNRNDQVQYGSSQCNNSTTTIGVCNKKAKGQPSPSQPPLKVRKEKLGDRITALHQLVSPFGKTDTASVLLEAIGYIRFLQSQIEALSSPYLNNGSKNNNNMRNQNYVHGERNSVFPEDPGQLFNDIGLKRKVAPSQDAKDNPNELKSRGLCLVPVSFTEHIGNGNSSDYWAPAYASGL